MGENSKIAWTDHTFSPWWGCVKVSPGCAHCYAEAWAKRTGHACFGADASRRLFGDRHWNEPRRWAEKARKAGTRARVFCASMSDVLEDRPELEPERAKLWALVRETADALDWLFLSKRIENAVRLVPADAIALSWWGTTVESRAALGRVQALLSLQARVRFLSCEPLLEEIDLHPTYFHAERCHAECAYPAVCRSAGNSGIGWIIVGGESGGHARAFDLGWARRIVDLGRKMKVPVFLKQMGRNVTVGAERWGDLISDEGRTRFKDLDGRDPEEWPEDLRVQEWPR